MDGWLSLLVVGLVVPCFPMAVIQLKRIGDQLENIDRQIAAVRWDPKERP